MPKQSTGEKKKDKTSKGGVTGNLPTSGLAWHERLSSASRGKTRPPRTADDALLSTLQPDALKWIKTRRKLDSKAKVVISYARERQLREIFRGLDLQGVGVIDLKSLQKAAQYCEETTKGTVGEFKNIQAMFEGMDDDGNGEVDFAEFTGAMMGSTKSAVGTMSEQDIERLQRKFVEYAVENKRQHALKAIDHSLAPGTSHESSSGSIREISDSERIRYFGTLFGSTNFSKESVDKHDKLANLKLLRKTNANTGEDTVDEMIQEKSKLFKLHEDFIEETLSPRRSPSSTKKGKSIQRREKIDDNQGTTTSDSIATRTAPKHKRMEEDSNTLQDNDDNDNDKDVRKDNTEALPPLKNSPRSNGEKNKEADTADDNEGDAELKDESDEEKTDVQLDPKTKEYLSIQARIKAQRERELYELKADLDVRNVHKRIYDEKMFQLEMRRQHWNPKPPTARKTVSRLEVITPVDTSFKKELAIRRQAKEEAHRLFGSQSPPKDTKPLSPRNLPLPGPPPSSASSYFNREKVHREGVIRTSHLKSRKHL